MAGIHDIKMTWEGDLSEKMELKSRDEEKGMGGLDVSVHPPHTHHS